MRHHLCNSGIKQYQLLIEYRFKNETVIIMNYNSMIYYALSFTAVVKAGGYSSAAKKIGISKAQLSRHVSALETLLNMQLLHRTSRSMTLTEQGKQFFHSCEGIEQACAEAVTNIKHDYSAMQGTLRITATIDFGIQYLPAIIHQYSTQYPNMNVMLSLSNIYENLTEQNYDLAIRIANKLSDSNLHVRTITEFKRLICASPSYFKDKDIPNHPDELKNHMCITSVNRNMSTIKPQWQFQLNKKTVNYTLDKFIEVDSLFAQLELIKHGTGIGRLPNYFIRNELKNGNLIEIFTDIEKPTSYVYLLYPDTITIPRKTRAFIDIIKNLSC